VLKIAEKREAATRQVCRLGILGADLLRMALEAFHHESLVPLELFLVEACARRLWIGWVAEI
jgi:hypothetical protein